MTTPGYQATRKYERAGTGSSIDDLIRDAMMIAVGEGLELSPSKCSRIIRRYVRRGESPDVIADELMYYCMPHRDPTGEDASANVDEFERQVDPRLNAQHLRKMRVSRGQIVALLRASRE